MDNRKRLPFKEDRIFRAVNDSDLSVPLMEFAMRLLPDAKRGDVKKWLKFGHFKVNGFVATKFDTPIEPGHEMLLNLTRPFPVFHHPRVEIVYEDDDVIVIHKGYGLLSVAAPGNKRQDNAFDIVKAYVKQQNPRNKLYIVHRLDRDTTGLMMFAKSEQAQEILRHNWNNIILERLYVAVLEGYLENDNGYVKSRLAENSQYMVYSTDNPEEGRVAVTHYDVISRGNGYTLAKFSLDTGRKNQIRVHAADLGHPISGDRKYGAQASPLHRLALHAMTLRFAHPITRKDMNFSTPVPPAFEAMVGRRRIHNKKTEK